MLDNNARIELAQLLLNDFLAFTRFFYKLRMGREFTISKPPGRLSHHIVVANALQDVFDRKSKNLLINLPPRYSKTELLIHFIAWTYAHNPRCNWLYISSETDLAIRNTYYIRQIMQTNEFRDLFGVEIAGDATAKGDFKTTANGSIMARGAMTQIVGHGAGLKDYDGFGGGIALDDLHKPSEIHSDVMRHTVLNVYKNTILNRRNYGNKTSIIHLCQRLHEDDLAANQINGFDGLEWTKVILPALDNDNNALDPTMHTVEHLRDMARVSPYVFYSQMQQTPQPEGGGIYKRDDFVLLDEEPQIIESFITADSAETSKTYNDATVFSFWGVYKLRKDLFGLHLINLWEIWVEPKDLENNFMQFYLNACLHKVPPLTAFIEKKSTGVTLLSTLSNVRGLKVIPIERTRESGSKTARFLEMQPYISGKFISLTEKSEFTNKFLDHMAKITNNDTHLRDDICDTVYDAVKVTLISKILPIKKENSVNVDEFLIKTGNIHNFTKKIVNSAYSRFKI